MNKLNNHILIGGQNGFVSVLSIKYEEPQDLFLNKKEK